MSKRLLALNVLVAVTAAGLAVLLARELGWPGTAARRLEGPRVDAVGTAATPAAGGSTVSSATSRAVSSATSRAAPTAGPAPPGGRLGVAAYDVVASRSLFSPNRSETSAERAAPARAHAVRPVLHGVVIAGDVRRAYLEDPDTKRVLGYKPGDAVAGGRIERIAEDRVVIRGPEGPLEVLLKDPAKRKPAGRGTAPPRGTLPPAVLRAPLSGSREAQGAHPVPQPATPAPGFSAPGLPGR